MKLLILLIALYCKQYDCKYMGVMENDNELVFSATKDNRKIPYNLHSLYIKELISKLDINWDTKVFGNIKFAKCPTCRNEGILAVKGYYASTNKPCLICLNCGYEEGVLNET
jgi:hypothetical protein